MNDILEIGIDEAGYGPLLGTLNLCAFVTKSTFSHPIEDSKKAFKYKKISSLENKCKQYCYDFNSEKDITYNDIHFSESWHKHSGSRSDYFDLLELNKKNSSIYIASMYVNEFNNLVNNGLNKAEILISIIHDLIEKALKNIDKKSQNINIKVDRLGGRKNYRDILISWGALINNFEETPTLSSYDCELFNKKISIIIKSSQISSS